MDVVTERQTVTTEDLQAINDLTLGEVSKEDVYCFNMKVADCNEVTGNKRLWTREFLESVVDDLAGIPIMQDHTNVMSMKVGSVISAKMKDDGLYARAYLPLTEAGKGHREAIENGTFKSVSLGAINTAMTKEKDYYKVMPDPKTRVVEISMVGYGGCPTCVITESQDETVTEDAAPDPFAEFGKQQTESLISEYIKFSGLVLGTDIDREAYKVQAESLDPFTLANTVADYKKAYSARNSQEKETEAIDSVAESIKDQISQINKVKGA